MSRFRIPLLATAFAVVALLVPATAANAKPLSSPCANRLCTEYKPGTPSCKRLPTKARVARCHIARAARHYGQPLGLALHIARRESRFNWRVTNTSSGAAGLYQFMPRTWASTPYGRRGRSPYNPKWASLGAMWMWSRGGIGHWAL